MPPKHETLVRRLPPWRALASFMAWSLDHLPPQLLRPSVMNFVTTALAPSSSLFEAGAPAVSSIEATRPAESAAADPLARHAWT